MTREAVQLDRYHSASYTRSGLWVTLSVGFVMLLFSTWVVSASCVLLLICGITRRERKLTCQLTSRLVQNNAHSRTVPAPLPRQYWLLFQRTLMRSLIQPRRFISRARRSAKWPEPGSRSRSFPWPMEDWAADWLILPLLPRNWHAW